jgi:hypothetical protein
VSITHQITTRVTRGGAGVVDVAFSKADASSQEWDFTLAANATDFAINLGNLTVAKIKSLAIVFDQDTTLETNSSSAATQTLAFKANVPVVWTSDMPTPCPFTADLTEIYLTGGATATAVKIYFVLSN